jgi:undecaprenyl-diphosphatase
MEIEILYWINGHHNAWLDQLMWWISGKWTFLPLYLLMSFVLLRRWGLRLLMVFVLMVILVTLSDQLASSVFKPWVKRERPSYAAGVMENLHYVTEENGQIYKGGKYGFYSSHASNTMAVAMFFLLILRPIWKGWTIILFSWVFWVGYSRVYLGVHYPTDILMGWLMGGIIAFVIWRILKLQPLARRHRLELH